MSPRAPLCYDPPDKADLYCNPVTPTHVVHGPRSSGSDVQLQSQARHRTMRMHALLDKRSSGEVTEPNKPAHVFMSCRSTLRTSASFFPILFGYQDVCGNYSVTFNRKNIPQGLVVNRAIARPNRTRRWCFQLVVAGRLSLKALFLLISWAVAGCDSGSNTAIVTPDSQLSSGPRHMVASVRTPQRVAVKFATSFAVAVGEEGTIWRSTDGGKSWAEVPSGTDQFLRALHGEGERLVAVGSKGVIVRSTDGGKSWAVVSSGIGQDLYALHGEGERLVAVGNNNGVIVRSTDSGKSWAVVSSGTDQDLFALHGEGERLVAVSNNGVIVSSTDGGKSWAEISSGTGRSLLALHGEGERLVAVGSNGVIVRSTDGGKSWAEVSSGTDQFLHALHGEGERLVAVGSKGVIVRSTDGGKNWAVVSSGTGRDLFALDGEGERLVAVGSEGVIVRLDVTGPRYPQVTHIDSVSTLNPSELALRIYLDDPDAQCAAECRVEVRGANLSDANDNSRYKTLAQPTREADGRIWRTTLKPQTELNVHPGENFFVTVRLSGAMFAMSYPLANERLRLGYLVNYTPYYVIGALAGLVAVLVLVFWLRPLWILSLYRQARLFELVRKIPVPGLADALQTLDSVLIVPWLMRQPRVLDAWLARQQSRWESLFRNEEAVQRLRYYPLPLERHPAGERIANPAPQCFHNDFRAYRTLMQIVGPGGSGKSSFAAQLGNWSLGGQLVDHPMVPVWLDEDIADFNSWLVNRVRFVSEDDELPERFIQALYRHKRLLVVADRLSEKQTGTQEAICRPPAYLNALVITSRVERNLGLPGVKVIEAVPLGSDNLMGFVNQLVAARIDEKDVYHSFKNQLDLAKRLADVITVGQQELPVTPLLVKLFVERALDRAVKFGMPDLNEMPRSVPEVYFDYLRHLNPDDRSAPNYLPHDVMMEAAKVIARVELGDDFRPKRVEKSKLREALKQADMPEKSDPIQRLLDNQVLESKDIGGSTLIAFALDPIAEYVAAFAYAMECDGDTQRWVALRARVANLGCEAAGFSEALRITHEVFAREFRWPADIKKSQVSETLPS